VIKSPNQRRRRRPCPVTRAKIDFDLTVLLASAGATGVSLPALTMLARDVTGDLKLTEADVRRQLNDLLARGLVAVENGRWKLK
jgi:hypothetical protein